MKYLRMFVGEAAWVQLDANQTRAYPITLYEGPIESVLEENLGLLEAPARLYGRVWTRGPKPSSGTTPPSPCEGAMRCPFARWPGSEWVSSGRNPSPSQGWPSSILPVLASTS